MHKLLLTIIILVCSAILPNRVNANNSLVYAVLFYSPTCPHCHAVIDNAVPRWQNEFGDRFKLVMVDVTTSQGALLFQAASETPGISFTSFGVPTLVIENTVLVGDVDIPDRLPALVREGLAKGGIPLPPIPGLKEAFAGELVEPTLIQRLALDPIANGLAIGILLVLVGSLGLSLTSCLSTEGKLRLQGKSLRVVALLTSLGATGLATTLLLKSTGSTILLTGSITLALLVETIGIARNWQHFEKNNILRSYLLPLVVIVGLVIAGYLSSIELTQNAAVCGLVGDCNAVQRSSYARLFGFLPIGLLGMFGYVALLLTWLVYRMGPAQVVHLALDGLRTMALFGVAFSIYLTFLEPFVIGATCTWCLTSAVIMLLVLWLSQFEPQSVDNRRVLHVYTRRR